MSQAIYLINQDRFPAYAHMYIKCRIITYIISRLHLTIHLDSYLDSLIVNNKGRKIK